MKKPLIGAIAMVLVLGATCSAAAQSLDDLNIEIHGYATQGFLYTTQNNILTTSSSNGNPAWNDAVVNITAKPISKLRIGVQGRYFLLGNIGNAITLDWAAADYKFDNRIGVRFGKVKTPTGLYNETQDIDPSYMWSLLPQGVYPILSRNSLLAHVGGVVYGTQKLGQNYGRIEYRGFGGERVLSADDGYLLASRELGLNFPNGASFVTYGGSLRWKTPLPGLMIGASDAKYNQADIPITLGPYSGSSHSYSFNNPSYFARYEKDKIMLAGEWTRVLLHEVGQLKGLPAMPSRSDQRSWYGMASYKLTDKLTAGVYDSQAVDHDAVIGPARHSMDWALSGRYDFNSFLYAKVEQHIINGTLLSYDTNLNPGGLKPTSKLTIFKVGVSF